MELVEIENVRAAAKCGDVDPDGSGLDIGDCRAAGTRNGGVSAVQVNGRVRAAVAVTNITV